MRVDEFADEAQQSWRKRPKNGVEPALGAICIAHERAFEEIELIIIEPFLVCAEAEFESSQPLVRQRGASQMQGLKVLSGIALNCGPNQQVAWAHLLKRIIGRPELINSLPAMMKEYGRGDGAAFAPHGNDSAMFLRQDMAMDILKKSKRLRWQSVATPGLAVQYEKGTNGIPTRRKVSCR